MARTSSRRRQRADGLPPGSDGLAAVHLPRLHTPNTGRRIPHPPEWRHPASGVRGIVRLGESVAGGRPAAVVPELRPGLRKRFEGLAPVQGVSGEAGVVTSGVTPRRGRILDPLRRDDGCDDLRGPGAPGRPYERCCESVRGASHQGPRESGPVIHRSA
jgi:hypothetical protein